jgi:hypothetical protein
LAIGGGREAKDGGWAVTRTRVLTMIAVLVGGAVVRAWWWDGWTVS